LQYSLWRNPISPRAASIVCTIGVGSTTAPIFPTFAPVTPDRGQLDLAQSELAQSEVEWATTSRLLAKEMIDGGVG
jgi:hypothetical protein